MSLFQSSEQGVEVKALSIARSIVTQELASIDRLHKRTLAYITGYTTVMALLFAVLGWIGYERLQAVVLDATMKNVEKQTLQRVNDRVDEDLKRLDVPDIINNKVADFADSDLRSALTEQMQHGPVNDLIRRTAFAAASGARSQVVQSKGVTEPKISGRFITDDQQGKFRECIAHRQSLPPAPTAGRPEAPNTAIARRVNLFVVPSDPEALNYANQIKALIKSVGWEADAIPDSFVATIEDRRFAVGVHFANNFDFVGNAFSRRSNESIANIFACLSQAGVSNQPTNIPASMKRDNGSFITIGTQH